MRWIRRFLLALVLVAAAALIVAGLLPEAVPVDTDRATRGEFRVTVDEDGRTRVKDRHVIAAPLAGNLVRVELHPGDEVQVGDVLARIVPLDPPLLDARTRAELEARLGGARAALRQAEAGTARAEAAAAQAQRDEARARQMAAQGALPELELELAALAARTRGHELDSARFGVRAAQHEVAMADAMLQRARGSDRGEVLEIRAPLAGRVLRVARESEGPVAMGEPILELGDPHALEVVVDVLTSDAVGIRTGARVDFERWGGETALTGRVRLVEPSAFTRVSALGIEEQRVNVLVDPDGPPEAWVPLGDGWRVEARIRVWETPDAVSVPASAVFRDGDAWAVFAVEAGRAERRRVGLGRRSGLRVVVTEGVAEGDTIVVHPSDRVSDGIKVQGT